MFISIFNQLALRGSIKGSNVSTMIFLGFSYLQYTSYWIIQTVYLFSLIVGFDAMPQRILFLLKRLVHWLFQVL